jgi:hypothetical protein
LESGGGAWRQHRGRHANELGQPGRQFRWNEYGCKGWSLTGVLAYGDLAASYSGYRFWSELSSIGRRDRWSRATTSGTFVRGGRSRSRTT